ncbi:polymorphic toxin type 15 domain-containing protein [Pseudoduganella sp. S-14]|uniref:polymorphic toxin type 15 domain-containing protein n=1 Tax=Pseudoduganella sp. S-14 TaxID=3404065 RepID=UPI003CF2B74F
MAVGIQEHFSWKSVAMSAIGSGVAAGIGGTGVFNLTPSTALADPTRMGSASVNSSIGPAWNSRVGTLDKWANDARAAGYGDRRMNVRLFIETGLENSGR